MNAEEYFNSEENQEGKTIAPKDFDYSKPLEVIRLSRIEELTTVAQNTISVNWDEIWFIEEYPAAYEEVYNWAEMAGKPKSTIHLTEETFFQVLVDFKYLNRYWRYYCKHVRNAL